MSFPFESWPVTNLPLAVTAPDAANLSVIVPG
jgi:hypothetical protein